MEVAGRNPNREDHPRYLRLRGLESTESVPVLFPALASDYYVNAVLLVLIAAHVAIQQQTWVCFRRPESSSVVAALPMSVSHRSCLECLIY